MNRVLSAAGAAGAAYNSRPVITDGTTYESSSLSSPSARSRSDTRNPGSGSNKNNESSDDENENPRGRLDPSPTGYRDYTPPAELLRNTQSEYHHHHQGTSDPGSLGAGARVGRVNDDNAPIIGSACSSSTFTDRRKNDEAFTHKTILLGDSGVGKTSLLVQFDTGEFQTGNFAATVGIGFTNKIVTVDNTRVKLQIWDTAGQERFRSITHAYYRDAHALLLLYDVTNKTSYDNIRAWLTEIREYAHDDVVIMLLGNKCDCGNERTVRKTDGERLAREHNVPFMETSAKTGLNVELAFFAVARQLKARKSEDPDKTKFNVQDYVRQQSQASNCFTTNCSTT